MKKNPIARSTFADATYKNLCSEVVSLLELARHTAGRAVNHVMTATYWEIGRRIVEHEQQGSRRAEYGERLLEQLAANLTARLGRGFSRTNLFQMRQFFLTHRQIIQTASELSDSKQKVQTQSGLSLGGPVFPLSGASGVDVPRRSLSRPSKNNTRACGRCILPWRTRPGISSCLMSPSGSSPRRWLSQGPGENAATARLCRKHNNRG